MPAPHIVVASLVMTLTVLAASVLAAGPTPIRPQVCEDAMNASQRNEPAAAQLKFWDACLAIGGLTQSDQSMALTERAAAYLNLGNATQARVDVEQAIVLAPHNPLAYYNRGFQHAQAQEHTQALRDFTYAIMNGMRDPVVFFQRAKSFMARDKPQLALEDMDQAVRHASGQAWVYEQRGALLADLGQPQRALLDYDKSLELDPGNGWVRLQRAKARFATGDSAAAEADVSEAIRRAPGQACFWDARGTFRKATGNSRKALEDYRHALRLKPDEAAFQNNLGWLLATSMDKTVLDGKESVRLAKRAVAQKRIAASLDTLAAAYARAGRFEEAIATQQETVARIGKEHKDERFLKDAQARLELYESGQPYTETKPPAPE